jgi:Flp pilus assembly protein TadG
MKLRLLLNRLKSDERGVAALEMALVAPVIAGLAFLSINLWEATMRRQQMDEALRVSSQYYLNGGSSDTDAKQLGVSAWVNKPANGKIDIDRLYRCGATSATATTVCSGFVPPATIVRITASGTTPGATFQATQVRQEMVRVR